MFRYDIFDVPKRRNGLVVSRHMAVPGRLRTSLTHEGPGRWGVASASSPSFDPVLVAPGGVGAEGADEFGTSEDRDVLAVADGGD